MAAIRGTVRGGLREQSFRDYRKQNQNLDDSLQRSVIDALQKSIERNRFWKLGESLGKNPNHPAVVRFRNAARAALIIVKIEPRRFASELTSETGKVEAKWKTNIRNLRKEIYTTLENPNKNLLAKCINMVSLVLIAVSTLSFIMETVPTLEDIDAWGEIENVVVTFFSLEFVLRLFTTPSLPAFCSNFLNWVDVAAILPFYFELILSDVSNGLSKLRVLRAVRLMRVFRIFKASKHSVHAQLLADTFKRSYDALLVLVFILFITLIIFAGAIYFVEKGQFVNYRDMGDPNIVQLPPVTDPFASIPLACWWGITTMTTVGYGDVVPFSFGGKLIASVCMLIGILVVALPVTIVGNAFSEVYRIHVKKISAENAFVTIDEKLKNSSFVNHLQKLRAKRTVLVHVFNEVETRVGRWRFKTQSPTLRPWSIAEQALLDSIIHDLNTLEAHLIQASSTLSVDNAVVALSPWEKVRNALGKRHLLPSATVAPLADPAIPTSSLLMPNVGRPLTPPRLSPTTSNVSFGLDHVIRESLSEEQSESDNAGGVGWLTASFEPEKLFIQSSRCSEDSDTTASKITQIALRPLPSLVPSFQDVDRASIRPFVLPNLPPPPPVAPVPVPLTRRRLRPLPPKVKEITPTQRM